MPTAPDHAADPHLQAAFDARHDSPMQRKFRTLCPWPVGVVFIEHPGMCDDDIRGHFRLMRELGFTALKQCQVLATTDKTRVMHMALDEGIIPWWYGEAGFETPTPELLQELGIDPEITATDLLEHTAYHDRQWQLMHDRVDREARGEFSDAVGRRDTDAPDRERPEGWVPSVQPTFNYEVGEAQKPLFLDWLRRTYSTIEALNDAWNTHHCMVPGPSRDSPSDVADGGEARAGWDSWEHLESDLPGVVDNNFREYRRTRDVLRYKADNYLHWLRDRLQVVRDRYPDVPVRAGGEMGLFLPFASRGTDMEGIAELMTDMGSFYPSLHFSWHFEEVDFETPITFYMQSSLAADWFKGGWSSTWESTGGPQQMTGGKAPFVPKARDTRPGFTVDEHVMTALQLSHIAGGFRGVGIWAWTVRSAGWEGGEFGLLDRNNQPTERARATGLVHTRARAIREEMWSLRKEPTVGVFQDFDMEAYWAAAARGGRDIYKSLPIRARIGASRALINANVEWEHVTGRDLRAGLADRYRSILLPACLALDEDLLVILREYVERGGRVVLDAPGGWFDAFGRILRSPVGSPFERLFGTHLADFQYSRHTTVPWRIGGEMVHGSTLDLIPTTADTAVAFDHATPARPKPAVTINRLGEEEGRSPRIPIRGHTNQSRTGGQAVILAFEASMMCFEPGNAWAEQTLLRHLLPEDYQPRYQCDVPTYRLAVPDGTDGASIEHYFLMNPGEDRTATLTTPGRPITQARDVLADEPLESTDEGITVELPPYGAAWLRLTI